MKPIPLGERLIGFLEHEIDELIDALAELRDERQGIVRTPRTAIGAEGRRKVAERAPAKRAPAFSASGRPSGKRKSATARNDAARAAESVSASGVVK